MRWHDRRSEHRNERNPGGSQRQVGSLGPDLGLALRDDTATHNVALCSIIDDPGHRSVVPTGPTVQARRAARRIFSGAARWQRRTSHHWHRWSCRTHRADRPGRASLRRTSWRYIDVIGSDLPGYAPVHVETLEVLGTTGQLGEIEDGLKLAFALPCGTYTLLAYGVSAADFKLFIASLKFD